MVKYLVTTKLMLQHRKDEELLKRRNIEPLLEDDDLTTQGKLERTQLVHIVNVSGRGE